jgi:hypothetical protein
LLLILESQLFSSKQPPNKILLTINTNLNSM